MYLGSVTVRRVVLAALAASWAVMAPAVAGAAPVGRAHAAPDFTLSSAVPGTPNLITDSEGPNADLTPGGASRVLRLHDAIDGKAAGARTAVDDDDVDVDTDESKRPGHDRYSAVLPRAPDAALDTIATPHVSCVSSLVLSASVTCPQGRAPPSVLS